MLEERKARRKKEEGRGVVRKTKEKEGQNKGGEKGRRKGLALMMFEIRMRTERESWQAGTHHTNRSSVQSANRPGCKDKYDSFSHLRDFSLVYHLVGKTGM